MPSPSSTDFTMPDPSEFAKNMAKVASQSQQLLSDFMARQSADGKTAFNDPMNAAGAFLDLTKAMAANPAKMMEAQASLWQDYMSLWQNTLRRFAGEEVEPVVKPERGDRRFKDKDWDEHVVFDFVKQSYLLTANWVQNTVSDVDALDPKTKRKVEFLTQQAVDAMSPSNFVMTNPQVLRATLEQNGDNLVRGLEHLIEDLERGEGKLAIRQTDMDAFEVGVNVATAPGKVVFQNELMQLIQYSPTTEEVHKRPLLIVPPWINKFYILDLQEETSFIRWTVAQGYTVFIISWVNPDASLAEKSFEDYMFEGPLAALDAIERATGEREASAIGYCIGGTLLACAMAYMAAKGDDRLKAATFFTAQVDFTEAGDLQLFIDDEQLAELERLMDESGGVLEGSKMAATFNMLRANDLIWSFVVNNYLLGKEPFPFDLLYWNSDSTRMPKAMHMWYLNHCYRNNDLAEGRIELGGEKIDLTQIKTPVYLQSSQDDHIAPYPSVFKAVNIYSGPVRFMLAGSGHIAGVANHPDQGKYWHRTNSRRCKSFEKWFEGSEEHQGSWWPDWDKWLAKKSGPKVPARIPGEGALEALEDAPGSFVKVKAGS